MPFVKVKAQRSRCWTTEGDLGDVEQQEDDLRRDGKRRAGLSVSVTRLENIFEGDEPINAKVAWSLKKWMT